MWEHCDRLIAATLLLLAAGFAGYFVWQHPIAGGSSNVASAPPSPIPAIVLPPHVTAAMILELDEGKFGVHPLPANDTAVVRAQGLLQPAFVTYCLQRPAGMLSFHVAGGGASEQYLSSADTALVAVLDEIYSMHIKDARSERLLLNIGSGPGFHTSHAAAAGVDVVAFDAQPACLALQHMSASANRHEHYLRLLNAGVGVDVGGGGGGGGASEKHRHGGGHYQSHHAHRAAGGRHTQVHSDRCDSSYTLPHGQNARKASPVEEHEADGDDDASTSQVPLVVLKQFLFHRRVAVVKVDVDGQEVRVLDTALEVLWKTVEYLIVRIFRDKWVEQGITLQHGDSALQAMTYGARRVVHVNTLSELRHSKHFSNEYINGDTYMFEFGRPIDLHSIRARHVLTVCS